MKEVARRAVYPRIARLPEVVDLVEVEAVGLEVVPHRRVGELPCGRGRSRALAVRVAVQIVVPRGVPRHLARQGDAVVRGDHVSILLKALAAVVEESVCEHVLLDCGVRRDLHEAIFRERPNDDVSLLVEPALNHAARLLVRNPSGDYALAGLGLDHRKERE